MCRKNFAEDGGNVRFKRQVGRDVAVRHERELEGLSDGELLRNLRDGDTEAYTELWRRHIQAALRAGHRLAPGRAEDLASEAFLAVYQQVTEAGNGPDSAFRAYLFTTMRNLASRWLKETALVETDPDLDEIDEADPLREIEDRDRATEVLDAFQELPERWQRVLWLTEVERVRRPQIAAEFGIKPSAVTTLYRRARQGLQLQWLMQHVPLDLRDDTDHVARLLPKLAVDGKLASPERGIAQHLSQCGRCSDLADELRATYTQIRGKTLAVAGFVGLGVVLPTASQLSLTGLGASAAALALGGTGVGFAVAASVGVLLFGGLVFSASTLIHSSGEDTSSSAVTSDAGSGDTGDRARGGADSAVENREKDRGLSGVQAFSVPGSSESAEENGEVPTIAFVGTTQIFERVFPERANPAPPGTIPDPSPGGPPGGSAPSPSALAAPVLTTPTAGTGYFAPVLAGTVSPGASVAIEFERNGEASSVDVCANPVQERHEIPVDAAGAWSFDLRPQALTTCTYDYRIWAYSEDAVSTAVEGRFVVESPEVTGFERFGFFEPLPIAEAETTGVVFEVHGPANGTVCLVSVWSGQNVEIGLDGTGTAVRRATFDGGGNVFLEFRACEGGFYGPPAEILFDVEDPDGSGFGGFGSSSSPHITLSTV